MKSILGLKFNVHSPVYFFDTGAFSVQVGDRVVVKTDQGMSIGTVVVQRESLPKGQEDHELKPIFRMASAEDEEAAEKNKVLAREALQFCKKCAAEQALEMKLVDVEIFLDRGKIIFFFTAPGRVDFRELVKVLVRQYQTRIELRQIGVRHETQMLGALGNCGMVTCCRQFLRSFNPVTIKMAKEQNLFLNPVKISGICGRLLCCLSYEEENYSAFYNRCPKIDSVMHTTKGPLKVLQANFFTGSLIVETKEGEKEELSLDEWYSLSPKPCKTPAAREPADSEGNKQPQPKDSTLRTGFILRPDKVSPGEMPVQDDLSVPKKANTQPKKKKRKRKPKTPQA